MTNTDDLRAEITRLAEIRQAGNALHQQLILAALRTGISQVSEAWRARRARRPDKLDADGWQDYRWLPGTERRGELHQ